MSESTMFEEDLPDAAKVTRAREAGGSDVLETVEVEAPTPGPGQLLVKTAAAGVNFIETYQRSGVYPVEYPFVPGAEGAGEVVGVGENVETFSSGQRIATAEASGTYATHFLVDAAKAVLVPQDVSDEQAAALPLQGVTAHYLINSTYRVSPGETVLTHAGAGGVGQILTQLLKARGARVITTTSTPEKAKIAEAAGADYVLEYQGFAEKVRQITNGEGVSVVYDGVGKDTFVGSLDSLAVRGTMVLFGGASGQVPPYDLQDLNKRGGLYITRPSVPWYLRNAEERTWRFTELFGALTSGDLKLDIGGTYRLEEAGRAHDDLEGRRTTGKLLLVP
ncbi:quinone oxidoreductase family protein [Nesterenkonia haasae]|uniref:quinone oxidoreductase family protein n=1 Tax=Nesterenkonia haasae TaxID=2587813 RepID=UPI001291E58F|nr:quinone oxidoreductase [Nesterenkonia haasae]NDK30822.1 quinone oxidoreductase [Nesterenkonia haasae]